MANPWLQMRRNPHFWICLILQRAGDKQLGRIGLVPIVVLRFEINRKDVSAYGRYAKLGPFAFVCSLVLVDFARAVKSSDFQKP